MKLNSEQNEAVSHYEGPCCVTAVPGSGKTAVLTSRVVHLIKQHSIDPRAILCLTFTNKATKEMQERISRVLGDGLNIWVSTFHKLCIAILRKHGHLIGLSNSFTIYDSKDQEELIAKIARMHEYECKKEVIRSLAKSINDFREEAANLSSFTQEMDFTQIAIAKEYLKTLDSMNVVDFSGILYKAWLLLKDHPEVAPALIYRFKFVLVDEFQDTNRVQYDIVRRIALPPDGNLFIVGDKEQSIFGWRGARPENIKNFLKEYNAQEIVLPRNYRSTSQILKAAQTLIRHNEDAVDVEIHSDRGTGADINILSCYNPEEESEEVARQIKRLRSKGFDWKDFAILYRMNSFSRSPEITLRSHAIPYRIFGGLSFFDRSEIKTTLAYLSLLSNQNDTIAFNRAISNPKRQVGPAVIGKLERYAQVNECSIIEACKQVEIMPGVNSKAKTNVLQFADLYNRYAKKEGGISEIAEGLLKSSGYYSYMEKQSQNDPDHQVRVDNIDELISGLKEFEEQHPNSKVADYLQTIQLASDLDESDDEENVVTLLTMHSAKGLEWPCVNIIGAERGCIPHYRVGLDGINEERRLMYVAMTRAMDHLSISYCYLRRNKPVGKSPFVEEIYGNHGHQTMDD